MKKILAACFFPAFDPPMSGGEVKLLKLYSELARYYHIDLVTFTYPTRSEIVRHSDHFHEHRIAKTSEWNEIWGRLASGGLSGELSGITSILSGRTFSAYREKMDSLWDAADVVMYDVPFMLPLSPRPADRNKIIVYNSQNFEAALFQATVTTSSSASCEMIERVEFELCRNADLILATSNTEAKALSLSYQVPERRMEIVPLGYDPDEFTAPLLGSELPPMDGSASLALADPTASGPMCFFIGSQHGPNVAAALEVVEVARRMPDLRFVIAGAVCDAVKGTMPDNLTLRGKVSQEEKKQLFQTADVFLNPMRDGAGMNVKMVEAVGAGLPVVTTAMGRRGFALGARDILIAEIPSEMVVALRSFLARSATQIEADRIARQAMARETYGWPVLAERIARRIEAVSATRGEPDTLAPITLFVNDFPIGDGAAGGQKRMLELIRNTPTAGDKVLLTLTSEPGMRITLQAPDFIEINIPKERAHLDFDAGLNSRNLMSVADITSALHVADNRLYALWLARIRDRVTTLVLEHPYMVSVIDAFADCPRRPRVIYNAYNVETDLKRSMAETYGHSHVFEVGEITAEVERAAVLAADQVVCVTQADAERFQALFDLPDLPQVVVNGTGVPDKPCAENRASPDPSEPLELIFIGSAHPPNTSALSDFVATTLPLLEDCHLTVVGTVGDVFRHVSLQTKLPANLTLSGRVSDFEKDRLLARAHVAVNPVTVGGGSSLKLGDYLCAGLPVVTTPAGMRGFDLKDEQSVLVAELGTPFAAAIHRLRAEPETWRRIAVAGETYARKELDWRALGARMAKIIAAAPAPDLVTSPPESVLAITFRYTEPRSGGAEEYLYNVLRRIPDANGMTVDVMALDLRSIQNTQGYVCEASGLASTTSLFAPFARSLRVFPLDERNEDDLRANGILINDRLLEDQMTLSHRARDLASGHILMGGWHHLEQSNLRHSRWMSAFANVHVAGPDIRRVRISGFSHRQQNVVLRLDETIIYRSSIKGSFVIERFIDVSKDALLEIQAHGAMRVDTSSDIRKLGLLINEIAFERGETWEQVPLTESLVDHLSKTDLTRFMNEVHDLAQERGQEIDSAFLTARGLRSAAALRAIETAAPDYDHVLVHGIQFEFIHDVCLLLQRLGKRFTLIPHLHLDDMFYHWKPIYDSIAAADTVICPENASYKEFMSRFDVNVVLAPGGGIDPCEFEMADDGKIAAFRARHGLRRPYFVVLGRKAPAKGYQHIITAFEQAQLGEIADLLLIGPEEDHVPINAEAVYYLGPITREDVVTALKGSMGLVSMSQSESFGIVLVEAWACGKPVIANAACAVFRDLVEDGLDGFVVTGTEELALQMRRLADDAELRTRLGEAGRAKAFALFDWARVANAIIDAMRGICVPKAQSRLKGETLTLPSPPNDGSGPVATRQQRKGTPQ